MNRVAKEGFLKCTWGNVAYKIWNKGAPKRAVFLHGWMDHLSVFEPLISNLSNSEIEILAVDLPGHGHSDHVSWPWNYSHSDLPKYMIEILDRMEYRKYHFVGHSFSGNSLTPSLAVSSDEVQSFTILDAHGVITMVDDMYLFTQRKALEGTYRSKRVENPKQISREELKKRLLKSTIPLEFQDLWLERGVKWNVERTHGHFARDIRLNENSNLLDHLKMPILRINGKESDPFGGVDPNNPAMALFDIKSVQRFSEEISKKENVTEFHLPGNHHFFLPQARETAKILEEFWSSVE
ncbi:unnamed protein product [Oikopleura dioica]|uniref:AB hydrolase-1 domain-containing protein n=1 Tax=Oikopleura dioica TaxID=34765 RepID=E4YKJ9_OIKDI|nr:unnamed protein product [Oikopleura dioica]